eukprot:g5377.t1
MFVSKLNFLARRLSTLKTGREEFLLLDRVRDEATKSLESSNIEIEDVLKVIDSHYTFLPTAFTNGTLQNEKGSNEGSCKILAWSLNHKLTKEEVLICFGRHYRNLKPNKNDHKNIREILANGVSVQFEEGNPLTKKRLFD